MRHRSSMMFPLPLDVDLCRGLGFAEYRDKSENVGG